MGLTHERRKSIEFPTRDSSEIPLQFYRQIEITKIIGVCEIRAKHAHFRNPMKKGFVRIDLFHSLDEISKYFVRFGAIYA